MTNLTKELLFVIITVTLLITATYLTTDIIAAVLVAASALLMIFFTKSIWLGDKSNFKIRGLTLVGIWAIVSPTSWWQNVAQMAFQYFYPASQFQFPNGTASATLLGFLLVLAAIIFYFTQDKKSLEQKNIPKLLQSPSFDARWTSVRKQLSYHIRDIDRSMNWQPQYYEPLEAEVEVETKNGKLKVVQDLFEAIQESNEKLYLLIGDPGAGKSVAMRKLCLDALSDSSNKNYIPLYINLKEWVMDSDWLQIPPTALHDIYQYGIDLFTNLETFL